MSCVPLLTSQRSTGIQAEPIQPCVQSETRRTLLCVEIVIVLCMQLEEEEEEEEEEGDSEDEEDLGSSQQSRAYVPPKVVATPYGMYVRCVTVSVWGDTNVFLP